MFDFEEEMKRYEERAINICEKTMDDSIYSILEKIQSTLKKYTKEQMLIGSQHDEIIDLLERNMENIHSDNITKDKLVNDVRRLELSEDKLVKSLIEIVDQFENIYRNSKKSSNLNYVKQIQMIWNSIINSLIKVGVQTINPEKDLFDKELHIAIEVKNIEGVEENTILDVMQCGFIHNEKLIRKSKIILNIRS